MPHQTGREQDGQGSVVPGPAAGNRTVRSKRRMAGWPFAEQGSEGVRPPFCLRYLLAILPPRWYYPGNYFLTVLLYIPLGSWQTLAACNGSSRTGCCIAPPPR